MTALVQYRSLSASSAFFPWNQAETRSRKLASRDNTAKEFTGRDTGSYSPGSLDHFSFLEFLRVHTQMYITCIGSPLVQIHAAAITLHTEITERVPVPPQYQSDQTINMVSLSIRYCENRPSDIISQPSWVQGVTL